VDGAHPRPTVRPRRSLTRTQARRRPCQTASSAGADNARSGANLVRLMGPGARPAARFWFASRVWECDPRDEPGSAHGSGNATCRANLVRLMGPGARPAGRSWFGSRVRVRDLQGEPGSAPSSRCSQPSPAAARTPVAWRIDQLGRNPPPCSPRPGPRRTARPTPTTPCPFGPTQSSTAALRGFVDLLPQDCGDASVGQPRSSSTERTDTARRSHCSIWGTSRQPMMRLRCASVTGMPRVSSSNSRASALPLTSAS